MDNGSDPGEVRNIMMKVEIDANSGFCGGVIRAIKAAEDQLANYGGRLYSLGAIVHNEEPKGSPCWSGPTVNRPRSTARPPPWATA